MNTALPEPKAPAAPPAPNADAVLAQTAPTKPKRTLGLWLVDTFIYPVVNNFGVFAISLFATYLTERGWPNRTNGKAVEGWRKTVGDFFRSRGVKMDAFFENTLHFSKENAAMARMVSFSFVDGTFVAPFVKLLEDRREKMAIAIDRTLGTKPEDESVYEAEPKQSWASVIKGRFFTSLVVVPTAVLLSKKNATGKSLNDFLFNDPGLKRGDQVEQHMPKLKAGIEKIFGQVHFPSLFKIAYFEAFYTSVCTGGLYLISRAIAKKQPGKSHSPHPYHIPKKTPSTVGTAAAEEKSPAPASAETPSPKVRETTLENRLMVAAEPALTT